MGCGCGERRALAVKAVDAFRRDDRAAVKEHLSAMGASIRGDLQRVGAAVPMPKFRVKPEVAKAYGLTNRS